MILQLTSGIGGPLECAYAVGGVFQALQVEFSDIEVIDAHPARREDCFTSITFSSKQDLSALCGTILWVCRSPFRSNHRRKNWFIGCSALPEVEKPETVVDFKDIRFERFHSGGPGGQNVNKVETGVRLIHEPSGITVTCTGERTQGANRREAMHRLATLLQARMDEATARQRNAAWRAHGDLERGNPVRVYRGMDFVLDNG